MLYQFHGVVPVKLTLHFDGRGKANIEPHPDLRLRPCPDFCQKVQEAFGPGCLELRMYKPEARKSKSEGRER